MNENNHPSPIRIGNAQGFWGDSPHAPARLVKQQPNLDYLTMDYLAEVSMSILAIQREKDHTLGYAQDFLDVIRSLMPFWENGSKVKVVTNAGGLNPVGCAKACQELINQTKCCTLRIGVVSGDDVLMILRSSQGFENPQFKHLESGKSLREIDRKLVTANAYLGAKPIAEALLAGADIVITGRVADPSLTVGPCIAHYNWSLEDYDRLAGATIAGHLIECGTQVTGGISTHWLEMPDPAHIGFPVVEVSSDGSCIVTKPPKTGGRVTLETVKEQLLYEIGDPGCYLSPDATVSFLSLHVEEVGQDRVLVSGAKGSPPPATYKVSATYRDGYKSEGMLVIFGQDAAIKARRCGEIILQRLNDAGYAIERSSIECIGAGAIAPGVIPEGQPLECVLRIALADPRKEALECFSKELASLVTSGPQGVTGYMSGRPNIRPVFGYWPCLIERKKVNPIVKILESE